MNSSNENSSTVQSAGADPSLTALLRRTYAAPADPGYWVRLEQRVTTRINAAQLLSAAYSSPTDEGYWNGLESRIMSRVREQNAWWAVLPEWRAAGMVAAAAALFLVGATTVREQQRESTARERAAMAAEARVIDSSIEPVNMAFSLNAPGKGVRSATPERYIDLIRP